MILTFLDKDGNPRPPADWDEVKQLLCDNWDECAPCCYKMSFGCTHPMNPRNQAIKGAK